MSAKHKSGRKPKLSEKDCWTLHQIFRKNRRTTALKITFKLNERPHNSTKTVHRELYKKCSKKELLSQTNFSKHLELVSWAVERSDFLWLIVVFLISNNWPSVCLERAERNVSFRLPSANCENDGVLWWPWTLFRGNTQGQWFFFMEELTKEIIYKIWVTKFTLWAKLCLQRKRYFSRS